MFLFFLLFIFIYFCQRQTHRHSCIQFCSIFHKYTIFFNYFNLTVRCCLLARYAHSKSIINNNGERLFSMNENRRSTHIRIHTYQIEMLRVPAIFFSFFSSFCFLICSVKNTNAKICGELVLQHFYSENLCHY